MSEYINREAILGYLNDIWLTATPTDSTPAEDKQLAICRCMGLQDAMDAVKEFPGADTIEELQKQVLEWQKSRDLERSLCEVLEKQIPRWIPVTERLPENDGRYLVCNQPYKAQWVMIQEYWKDSGWSGSSVTHWMPLPEPPKEEA